MKKGRYSIRSIETSNGTVYQIEDRDGVIYAITYTKIWAEAICKVANSKF